MVSKSPPKVPPTAEMRVEVQRQVVGKQINGMYILKRLKSLAIIQFSPISLLKVEVGNFITVMTGRFMKYLTEIKYIDKAVQKYEIPESPDV